MTQMSEAGDLSGRHDSGVQAARKMYDDLARGDVEAILAGFHPDVEWHEAEGNPYQPDGMPFRGPGDVLEKLFVRLGQDWTSFVVTPHTFHECSDGIVVVEARYTGTFGATGRPLDCQVCHILTYEDSKLRKFQQYVDTAQLRTVMGA